MTKALLFIHALTPMHPGSGTSMGVVDLPIQRERHTGWPVIPGSALKGILRDACRSQAANDRYEGDLDKANKEDDKLTAVFGPGLVDDANTYAGALSATDARILAFPVRSLKGVFAWCTCPSVIDRFRRDAELAGENLPPLFGDLEKDNLLCSANSRLLLKKGGEEVVLEEFEFTRAGDADAFADWLSNSAVADEATQRRLKDCLVVLNDENFTHFVRYATEVSARIGLNYDTKTVKAGALFYEEFLPSETIFYGLVLASNSRKEKNGMNSQAVMEYLAKNLPAFLQIGADETIGKGICVPKLVQGGGK